MAFTGEALTFFVGSIYTIAGAGGQAGRTSGAAGALRAERRPAAEAAAAHQPNSFTHVPCSDGDDPGRRVPGCHRGRAGAGRAGAGRRHTLMALPCCWPRVRLGPWPRLAPPPAPPHPRTPTGGAGRPGPGGHDAAAPVLHTVPHPPGQPTAGAWQQRTAAAGCLCSPLVCTEITASCSLCCPGVQEDERRLRGMMDESSSRGGLGGGAPTDTVGEPVVALGGLPAIEAFV